MPELPPVLTADAVRDAGPCRVAGTGVGLRPWTAEDADVVATAFADPAIAEWRARQADEDDDDPAAWIAGWARRWAAGSDAVWAVAGPDGDEALGYVGVRRVSGFDRSAELSYWMLPAARGGGLARRAATTATGWAFAELGLHRVWLVHALANVRACAVASGAGFRVEGTLRGALRTPRGWQDAHLHARLATD